MIHSPSSFNFEFLRWFVQDFFFVVIVSIHSFFPVLPVVLEVFPKYCAISPLNLFPMCRGIVTADVLELGLSRGAIASRKLEGVMRDKEYEDLYWFGPLQ